MIAVDANVIVRFLARDHPAQAAQAKALIETKAIFVPVTVVLETVWVLRTNYGFDRDAIARGLTRLLGLPGLQVEDASALARALDWYRDGLDFADALHLASSGEAEAFASFDLALRRKSRRLSGMPAVVAP